jgi:hypothetical protein
MIARCLDAGSPRAGVLDDTLYGADGAPRRTLEERGQPYVLTVRSDHTLRLLEVGRGLQTDRATVAANLQEDAWAPLSAGEGAKGPRL